MPKFDESEHPRDGGKFTTKGGGDSSKKKDNTKGMGEVDRSIQAEKIWKTSNDKEKRNTLMKIEGMTPGVAKNISNFEFSDLNKPFRDKLIRVVGGDDRTEVVRSEQAEKTWKTSEKKEKLNALMNIDGVTRGMAKNLSNFEFSDFNKPFRDKLIQSIDEKSMTESNRKASMREITNKIVNLKIASMKLQVNVHV